MSQNPDSAFSEAFDEKQDLPLEAREWLQPMADRQVLVLGADNELPCSLPYDGGRFDLVICDHVSASTEISRDMLSEIGRVLNADGRLLIVDTLVPGSRLRGKKARRLRDAGTYVNAWLRLRNPRHNRYLDQDAWIQRLTDSQWDIQQKTTREVVQDFDSWADAYVLSVNNRVHLRAMLIQAPEKVHSFLTPLSAGDRIAFRMIEVFILATNRSV